MYFDPDETRDGIPILNRQVHKHHIKDEHSFKFHNPDALQPQPVFLDINYNCFLWDGITQSFLTRGCGLEDSGLPLT